MQAATSSEHHLLISPDLYHEFGHILHEGLKIELFNNNTFAKIKPKNEKSGADECCLFERWLG